MRVKNFTEKRAMRGQQDWRAGRSYQAWLFQEITRDDIEVVACSSH